MSCTAQGTTTGGKQSITDIDLPAGLVKPSLTMFSSGATISLTENNVYSLKTEVS
ncbi:MAG: hypothetical protein ABR992_17345 [Solirubrobacteraceae bacterium]|jgi:hypothetical protein